MNGERVRQRLVYMRRSVRDALEFVQGMTREEFLEDRKTQAAVVMCLVALGESAIRIAEAVPTFIDSHPEVPWQQMRKMRNRIAHGYFEIDIGVVWATVERHLPPLLADSTRFATNEMRETARGLRGAGLISSHARVRCSVLCSTRSRA